MEAQQGGLRLDQVQAAKEPATVFGRAIAAEQLRAFAPFGVVSMPDVWDRVEPYLPRPTALCWVDSMDATALDELARTWPTHLPVVGVGGGRAMDAAKHVACQRHVPLVLVPSALTVDAMVTNTVGVRVDGSVVYRGFVVADRILVDFDLLETAPKGLNVSGAGDLLSIHTALWDWEKAPGHALPYDEVLAKRAKAVLSTLWDAPVEPLERWGRILVDGYLEENAVCLDLGGSLPEEGSEHYFAYALERIAGHGFVHGYAVSLGVLLMSERQNNDCSLVGAFLRRVGMVADPIAVGVSMDQVIDTLIGLPAFVERHSLPPSVINLRPAQSRREAAQWLAGALTKL